MRAYKFLRPGARGPFSGIAWTGDWVASEHGVYACTDEHLPLWIWEELWEVELDGAVTRRGHKLHAPHGRLVRRVDGWSAPTAKRLAHDAALRASLHASSALRAAGHPDAADAFAEAGDLQAIGTLTSELWDDLPADARRPVGMVGDGAAGALNAAESSDAYVAAHGAAVTAYIAAMTAWEVGGRDAYDAERAHQADWFARELELA